MPKMSDWGGVHLAFYVDDMEAALAYLEDVEGVRIVGGAKETMGIEVGEGSSFAHFLTPWGMMLEFVSFPNGRKYMENRDQLLWSPVNPAA
jgi:catechol 2,3-dioxygenase-like lactoylglutathione lyase family enzyme